MFEDQNDGNHYNIFYEDLGYSRADATKRSTFVYRWYIVLVTVKRVIYVAELLYTGQLQRILLAVVLFVLVGASCYHFSLRHRRGTEVRMMAQSLMEFERKKELNKAKKQKQKQRGFIKVNGKMIKAPVKELWLDTIVESASANLLSSLSTHSAGKMASKVSNVVSKSMLVDRFRKSVISRISERSTNSITSQLEMASSRDSVTSAVQRRDRRSTSSYAGHQRAFALPKHPR